MKKILVSLLFACLFITGVRTCVAANVDLDAPVQKVVTIKSEIKRGFSAIHNCGIEHPPYDYFRYSDCVNNINSKNEQLNTDTEGYKLGSFFANWLHLEISLNTLNGSTLLDSQVLDLIKINASTSFKEYRNIQKDLGITDEELANITNLNIEAVNPKIKKWSLNN